MADYPITPRNRVRRKPGRGRYDRRTVHAIIDEALVCHVAFGTARGPSIIPMLHARRGDSLLLHGARSSRLLRHLASGEPVAVGITLLDALVLARSAFNSSANYRAVVIHGNAKVIEAESDKLAALESFTEHICRGRWADCRLPTRQELKGTTVVEIPIDLASAKIRTGPPSDDAADYSLPLWAGLLPVEARIGRPVPDQSLPRATKLPKYLKGYSRRGGT